MQASASTGSTLRSYAERRRLGWCLHMGHVPSVPVPIKMLYCIGELYNMQERSPIALEGNPSTSQCWLSFPVQLTSFVGREHEIATVCELLRRPEIRLLTLVGIGGVGKTRLSLEVATRLGSDFADQVYFVSLMETGDSGLVFPEIAKVLGVQEPGGQSLLARLQTFLKEKSLLLLLDNFEWVIEAAPTLANLLGACPNLKILVTSREILRVSGEYTFFVPPLELPDCTLLPEKEELLRYSAVTLFLERTRAVLPEFSPNEENSRIIAEICILLDGIPLAIELAVPRLKLLSPKMLLKRLDHRFQVLTRGMSDAPGRHQTLQNTMEWSYRTLTPREQQLFRFLSIFIGGCTLQAVEATWELAGLKNENGQVIDALSSLIDKSILYRSNQGTVEPHLLMLRTLREYGLQLLILTGELEQFRWAHAMYHLALAEEAAPELKGPQPRPWLECLEREHDNLHSAFCTLLIAHGKDRRSMGVEMALRLGNALERFWIIGGHVKEGRELIERALKKSQGISSSLRSSALCVIATLARYQGDFHYAMAACEESLAIFRELGDTSGIAEALYRLGCIVWMRGDSDTARRYYEEGLALSQGGQCEDIRSETLYCFASLALFQRDIQTARLLIEESLELSRGLRDKHNIASSLNILGWVMLLQEDITIARTLQEESLTVFRELGNQRGMAHALSALGEIACMMGEVVQACEFYKESLTIIIQIEDRWVLAIYMERLARVAVAQGEAIWAVHLLSVASVVRQRVGTATTLLERDPYEQILNTLHERLDRHVFAAAWAQGQAMSPQQVVAAGRPSPQVESLTPLEIQPEPVEIQPVSIAASLPALHDDLTPRERDVLRLVALGLTDFQVAERLVISPRTVNFHLTSIYRKLQVSSRGAAIRYALQRHLFEET